MAFYVGQKVVCVDASATSTFGTRFELTKDAVYHVRWCNGIHVRLQEILIRKYGAPERYDWPFRADRFRPLIEKKTETGMAILQEILDRESIEDRKPVRVKQ